MPVLRPDLTMIFASFLCQTPPNGPREASPERYMWSKGFYEAQIEGVTLPTINDQKITVEEAQTRAKTLAQLKNLGGYAGGNCPDGTGWAMAMPATAPLQVHKNNLLIPIKDLEERCLSWHADYISYDRGRSQKITKSKKDLELPNSLSPGIVSLTCQKKWPKWAGPEVWYLHPVGAIPAKSVPPEVEALSALEFLPQNSAQSRDQLKLSLTQGEQAIINWINRIRKREGLPALKENRALSNAALALSISGEIAHNMSQLKYQQESLKEKDVKLLGEDRVRGGSLTQMAWLLWMSPEHRDLLLHSEGQTPVNAVGVALNLVGSELLSVITIGYEKNARVSRRTKPQTRR